MSVAQNALVARPPHGGDDFEKNRTRFAAKYRTRWWSASTRRPDLGAQIQWLRQRRNGRRIDHFTDRLEGELPTFPTDPEERAAWSLRMRETVQSFGRSVLPLSEAECRIIFCDDYFEATARFAREARAFDPDLRIHDLSQALRNVWIMHLLQLLLEQRIGFTPSILGYSLLYPYTDNHLDQAHLPADLKRDFCQRLEYRLAGTRLQPRNAHEQAVFRLIGLIEDQFPRYENPGVYSELLAIHHAQTRSLDQHDSSLCEAEILAISVEKGGASVLADGYLVAGDLSREEADFFFGYGVFLQLADDLQDLEEDLRSGHDTLFTRRAPDRPLDPCVNRLVHFLDSVLESERFSARRFGVLKSLIRSNCLQLIVQAVGHNPRFFSRRYLRFMERHSMVRFSYLRKNRGILSKRYRRLDRVLSRETSIGSIFEALS